MVAKLPKAAKKIWKMLQCVKEKIKSADEKLRSIGSKPQQPQPPHHQQQQQQRHYHHPQQQQQQQQAPPPPVPAREPVMAERRVQMRQGRRERRRDGDGDGDLKRRSRSEGPSGRRVAQSMDVSSGNSNNNSGRKAAGQNQGNASFERREARGGPTGRTSPAAGSDDGGFVNPDPSGSDSDSDSDRMQWTKNPLLVRRVKKNKSEKRNSGAGNSNSSAGYKQLGQRSTNRESWVYLAPDGAPLPAGSDPQRGEAGSNSGSLKSKYQKLEEMRKKRIDIAVTSDEENTPESRISRLRQRALQGALGNQPRADNSRVTVSDHNGWGPAGTRSGQAVMSDQGSRQARGQPVNQYSSQAVAAQPQAYKSGVVVPAQPAGRLPQHPMSQSGPQRPAGGMASHPLGPERNAGQPYQQPLAPVRQSLVRPFTDRGAPEASSPGSVSARQQFYTIPEPQVGSRAVQHSSPEIHVRRFNPAARVPSADSIYDSVNYAQDVEANRYIANRAGVSGQRAFAQVNPPTQDVMEIQRGTAVQYQAPGNQRQPAASQFNEVVELRLKSSRVIDRPLSQSFKDPAGSTQTADGGFHSEDSLDELIESNIQYLEREISQGVPKKSTAPVSRSSSLPDPRKTSGAPSKPQVTVSGQQSVQPAAQAPAPTHVNKSELHFRVPLLPQTTSQPPPQIQIAEENQWSDSAYFGPAPTYTFGVVPVPRAERKHSYDSRTRTSRPSSEYYDRDDLSKSDTQLNAAVVPPTYRSSMLHPNYITSRGCVSDQNLSVEQAQGMFSDVEYDIEVAERVKKWEKFMKKPDFGAVADGKKAVTLTPIEERMEGDRDSLMMPSEVRRSIRMSQHGHVAASPAISVAQSGVVSLKPASSDPTLNITGDARVLSKETNLHRFFQVVQDPSAGLQVGPHLSQSTSSVYIDLPQQLCTHSTTLYQQNALMSPDQLRQHMLANQRIRAEEERRAEPKLELPYSGTVAPENPDATKRLSRYQDEIDEMTTVKHQSVSNLRRRFDEGKAMTSEDESRVSDSRVAKVSPTQKEDCDVNWSQMITGLEDRIRDMEVWSPSMESTQGNVVSIERVKARTLQTIPFSEDPFWKEIEEMTTFDPNSLGGHLAVSEGAIKPSATQTAEASPHSSTLPTQPRQHSTMSMRERLQRSKSLYTPNITPLTISVDPYAEGKSSSLERGTSSDKYSGPNALDEVLEDIRSSLERKPLSPKRRAGDSSDSHRSSPGPGWTSELMRSRSDRARATGSQTEALAASSWDNATSNYSSQVAQPVSISISSSQKPVPAAGAVSGMTAGHYHLDPNLLMQKLLSTGLVEDDKPAVPARSRVPAVATATTSVTVSKPVAVAPPQTVVRSVVAPTQRAAPAVARSSQQQDKLSQVNESMEDLRQLAVNVEKKIGLIKSRLLTADDQNLDKILLALRKFAPSAGPRSPDIRPSNMQDFYRSKKTKLEDALNELERIYTSLDLNNDMLMESAERRDYPSYRTKPAGSSVNATSAASTGLTASQARTKSSSIYISPIPVATVQAETTPSQAQTVVARVEVDKQTQSEFDMISKSFQAIIDEVNKTASLVSSASTPQPRPQPPLPEIKELQSKVYASREQELERQKASPEVHRPTFNVTVSSRTVAGPTPKSPPAVAPKPSFRVQTPTGLSPQLSSASPSPAPTRSVSAVTSSPQAPVTSVVRAEMAKPAPEKRDARVRGRFRPKTASQEREDASRRARSKSSPTISAQDLPTSTESSGVTGAGQTTTKSQLNFQIEPASGGKTDRSRKPPLHLDVARAQQGDTVELHLKPPAMFQDRNVKFGQPVVIAAREPTQVVAQPFVVKPTPPSAPPLDSKMVVYPGSPTVASATPPVAATEAAAEDKSLPRHEAASSSESSAEGREKKSKQRLGRGVAMMVELFSSSDDERLRRSQPLHTRSAPDLSADIPSDDATSVPKDGSIVRPAELSRVLHQRGEAGAQQGSPVSERKGVAGQCTSASAQNDALSSPQSPSNKPPFHPLKRQQPSPDRASESSPQRNAVPVSEPPATSASNASTANSTSIIAPAVARLASRVRPVRSTKADDDGVPERPRSVHELLSSFEPDPERLSKLRTLRKYASDEMFPFKTVVARVFQPSPFTSEPDLRGQRDSAPTPQEVRQWKLQ